MLKCGLLNGDRQVGDFRFVSWFYGQQKPYARQQSKNQTLADRLKTFFPDIVDPFQVVFIGNYSRHFKNSVKKLDFLVVVK